MSRMLIVSRRSRLDSDHVRRPRAGRTRGGHHVQGEVFAEARLPPQEAALHSLPVRQLRAGPIDERTHNEWIKQSRTALHECYGDSADACLEAARQFVRNTRNLAAIMQLLAQVSKFRDRNVVRAELLDVRAEGEKSIVLVTLLEKDGAFEKGAALVTGPGLHEARVVKMNFPPPEEADS